MLFDFVGIDILVHIGIRQELTQLSNGRLVERLWEFDVKGNVEVPLDKGVAVAGHALSLDRRNVGERATGFVVLRLCLDDFTGLGLDDNLASIQVREGPLQVKSSCETCDPISGQDIYI